MKKIWSNRTLFTISLVVILLLSVTAPALAKSELVRLIIENRTTSNVYLRLSGPAYYYLIVKGGDSEVFTVTRGVYDSWIYACGASHSNTLDLTIQRKLIMPICGGNARMADKTSERTIDLSSQIKVVKFKLINESDTQLLAIFTGASTYVFTLKKGESKDLTIKKGDYTVKWFACSSSRTREFQSYPGSKLVLRCP